MKVKLPTREFKVQETLLSLVPVDDTANLTKANTCQFEESTRELAGSDKNKAVVFHSKDRYRVQELERILSIHQIEYFHTSQTIKAGGTLSKR